MKKIILFLMFILPLSISCCGNKIKFNNDKNDYFIIREPDSLFFTKNGQKEILKDFNVIILENRYEDENIGIKQLLAKIDEKIKTQQNTDVLYARPEPFNSITFHWNVFAIYKDIKKNILYIISNDNDNKAKEMAKILNILKNKYKNVKIVYLPQIQYSYKGCSVKGAMFVKEIHKNNNELLNVLLKIAKQYQDNEIFIQKLINDNKIDKNDKEVIIKRYLKFIQKDDKYNEFIEQKIIKNKHKNGTKIKTDKKTGKDIYIKNSKLHDKGYSYLYNDLLTKEVVQKSTKITKKNVLYINNCFKDKTK